MMIMEIVNYALLEKYNMSALRNISYQIVLY